MKHSTVLLFYALLGGLSMNVLADSFDGGSNMLCSMHSILECSDNYQCDQVTPESVNLVNYFEISVSNKEIKAAGLSRQGATTPIERIEHMGSKLLMQGGDLDDDYNADGLGWSIIVDKSDGKSFYLGTRFHLAT